MPMLEAIWTQISQFFQFADPETDKGENAKIESEMKCCFSI